MNTTTNPAPVDVLPARAAEILAERLDDGSSIDRENLAIRIARLEQRDAAVAKLIAQRDALAASLRRAVEAAEARMPNATFLHDARAALARVQGGFDTPSGHDYGCVEHPPGHAQSCSCGARCGGAS